MSIKNQNIPPGVRKSFLASMYDIIGE